MATERIQRLIYRLLDQAEEAVVSLDWRTVGDRARAVLAFEPNDLDALAFLAASRRALATQDGSGTPAVAAPSEPTTMEEAREDAPSRRGDGCPAGRRSGTPHPRMWILAPLSRRPLPKTW